MISVSNSVFSETVCISDLMQQSGVKFGTSGARGLANDMTDRVCYAYTLAFLHVLQSSGEIQRGSPVAIAGDFRSTTPRIMAATAMAVRDAGCHVVNCAFIPTPALALYGINEGIASLMVTGSHIPDDRNGIKFYKPMGEILKRDEAQISRREVVIPNGLFDRQGGAIKRLELPTAASRAYQNYLQRYLDFFGRDCLKGARVGLYEHSSVARDLMGEIFSGLGAEVISLGRSEKFIPVDTEAVRPEDVTLAREWASEHDFDCIISTDGDGDRPLISDEQGNWLRGDVAGLFCARYLGAKTLVTPVSSNSAVEKSGWFETVERTRIGSPFVIAAMEQLQLAGKRKIVGYEANGGFLIATEIEQAGQTLTPLPTRDALIVLLTTLLMARQAGGTLSALLKQLPACFTSSDRLKAFPTELSQQRIAAFSSGDRGRDSAAIEAIFGAEFGAVESIDETDGLRITFGSEEVLHLRPSGNAPELRCYTEAASAERADQMARLALQIMAGWR